MLLNIEADSVINVPNAFLELWRKIQGRDHVHYVSICDVFSIGILVKIGWSGVTSVLI